MTAATVAAETRWLGEQVASLIGRLPRDLVTARPGRQAPPIAFHAWHVGRWSDRLAAAMPRLLGDASAGGGEVWERDRWAARWGFATGLGIHDSGWGLDDDLASDLPWPSRAELLGYVEAAFGALDDALGGLSDADLGRECIDLYDDESTVGEVVVGHLSHVARHLGMIEGIAGALGERGTATA